MDNNLKGAMMAVAAAGLFGCASGGTDASTTKRDLERQGPTSRPSSNPATQASSEMVKCAGINECKGHGACAGQGHDCAGHNECKGQGWVEIPATSCADQGGTVI